MILDFTVPRIRKPLFFWRTALVARPIIKRDVPSHTAQHISNTLWSIVQTVWLLTGALPSRCIRLEFSPSLFRYIALSGVSVGTRNSLIAV
jgi:hypothetical protein